MSYKDITAGERKAKPIAARFMKSKNKGTMGFEVIFEFEEPSTGSQERQGWVGWLSAAAMENTMDTLVNVLGFNGNDTTNEDGTLSDPEAINWDAEVKIVIEMEEYNGKNYPKIKWVNKLSGGTHSTVEVKTLKADLDKLGFKAAFLMAKKTKTEALPF
jgi:hypothetical protein